MTPEKTQALVNQRFREAIKLLMKQLRTDKFSAVCDYLGVEYSHLYQIAGPKGAKNATIHLISVLAAKMPQLNLHWLVGVSNEILVNNVVSNGTISIPIVPITAHASFIEHLSEDNGQPLEEVPVMASQVKGIKQPLLFEVSGESMLPLLKPGYKVLTTPIAPEDWKYLTSAVYVVALRNGTLLIKRVIDNNLPIDGTLTLHSDNAQHGRMTINEHDLLRLWRVVRIVDGLV